MIINSWSKKKRPLLFLGSNYSWIVDEVVNKMVFSWQKKRSRWASDSVAHRAFFRR